ncbi:hypothetical protein ABZ468_28180 [Streptomyces sp. NPDC005708]|uniref:hypothetical protein n=1 Tax=Streptomyces sp. NPDC005708 TaxID=3154564 RepID=UPI0033E4A5B5
MGASQLHADLEVLLKTERGQVRAAEVAGGAVGYHKLGVHDAGVGSGPPVQRGSSVFSAVFDEVVQRLGTAARIVGVEVDGDLALSDGGQQNLAQQIAAVAVPEGATDVKFTVGPGDNVLD